MIHWRSLLWPLFLVAVRLYAYDLSTTNRESLVRFWNAAEQRPGPVTVLSFGDSMADSYRSIGFVLMNEFAARFGIAGYALNNWQNKLLWILADGAQRVVPSEFWFAQHFRIPSGGSVFWESQPPGGVLCDRAGVFYVAHPGGGQMSFGVSTNNGPWAALQVLDAFAPTPEGRYASVDLRLDTHRIQVTSLSGTNYVIGVQVLNRSTNGLQGAFTDEPGINIGQITNVPLSIRIPIFQALSPDLIIWHMKEEVSEATRVRLFENESWWAQAVPEADVLYIGTSWVSIDTNTTTTIDQNLIVRSVAVGQHRAYVDCTTPGVSYEWLYAQGYIVDGTHLNLAGSTYLASIAWNDLDFFVLRKPRLLTLTKEGSSAQLGFSTEADLTYTLEQSSNPGSWYPIMTVSNVSGMQTTNVMLTSSNAFYRLKLTP